MAGRSFFERVWKHRSVRAGDCKELKNHPELRVRMGIHSGPVNEVTDLNEQANIAGAGSILRNA